MENTVNISDDLLREAQKIAEASDRSLSEQIELWAGLGRAIEPFLLRSSIDRSRRAATTGSLSEAIRMVHTNEGRQRLYDYLATRPFPHFEAVKDAPGLLRKIDEDGTETVGKFVNRVFVPVEP
jgi:hypothetical protein